MSAQQLIQLLGDHPKTLVIDRNLSQAINTLVPFSHLKQQCHIEHVHWFDEPLQSTTPNTTFLIRSHLANINTLEQRLRSLDTTVDIIITDDYTRSFHTLLEQRGLLGDLVVKQWSLLIQTPEITSLNVFEFNSLYLYKTPVLPFKLANAVHSLNDSNLHITKIFAKGSNSTKLVQIYKDICASTVNAMSIGEKKQHFKIKQGLKDSGKQCDLVVLERNVDFLSLLLNQLDYQGLIDDTVGININTITIDEQAMLLQGDIWDDIKSMNFGKACDYLNIKAKQLQKSYDTMKQRDVSEEMITELKQLETLKTDVAKFTKLSEFILTTLGINDGSEFNDILELQQEILYGMSYSSSVARLHELINANHQITTVLRILGIISIVHAGLREQDYLTLQQSIIDSYGIKNLVKLQRLTKIGVIGIRGDPMIIKNFTQLNTSLQLLTDSDSYRGFTPLAAQLLRNSIRPTKRSSFPDLSSILGRSTEENLIEDTGNGGALQKDSTVILVMIGGITMAEMGSLKKFESEFEKEFGVKKSVVVVTDCVISAKRLLDSL